VHQHHGQVRFPAERRHDPSGSFRNSIYSELAFDLITVPHHGTRGGETGHPHSHSLALQHHVRAMKQRIARQRIDVPADVGKGRTGNAPPHYRHTPIEVMVAQCGRVIAREVHRLDDRVGIARCHAGKIRRERITLDEITSVHHNDLPRIGSLQRVDHGSHPRQSSGKRLIGRIVPVSGMAVHICSGHYHDMRRVLDRSR
jgi:hypothetical protein